MDNKGGQKYDLDLFKTLNLLSYIPSYKLDEYSMENNTLQQYNYHNWANERFFDHLKSLPDEIYHQQIESVFSSIEVVIKHICRVDSLWLSVMKGNAFNVTLKLIEEHKEKVEGKNREGMHELYKDLAEDYRSFLREQHDLHADFTVNHHRHGSLDTTIADLVQHVVNHGTYHRGNITAMLRQQGLAGVPTDYIYYLYEVA